MKCMHISSLKACLLSLAAALLMALPCAAFADGGEAHAPAPSAGKALSCAKIIAAADAAKAAGGAGHHSEDTVSVILHHVGNDANLSFESPLPTADGTPSDEFTLNFKETQCRLLGWNGVVSIGSLEMDLTPTKHTFWLWIGSLCLIILFAIGRPPKKGQWTPRGLYSFLEFGVLFVRDNIARENISDRREADRYTPYLLTAFFFIFVINLLGLVPWCASATANVSVTMALAFMTFCLTQIATIRSAGILGFLKHLTGGVHWALWPIMIPVEILGLFTKPFALMVRLFANMLAGHIVIYFLLGLIFLLKNYFIAAASVPFAAAIYLLEIFVAFIQAFIFTLLSAIFIGLGVEAGHHHHSSDSEEGTSDTGAS